MDYGPLVNEEIEAGESLLRKFDEFKPVSVAFWLKGSDDEFRYLFIASDEIGDGDVRAAYEQIMRLTTATPSVHLDPFRVKVISTGDLRGQAAILLQSRSDPSQPIRLVRQMFGDRYVDDVYVYPRWHTAAATVR
ncbi:MAG: hypothetical protein SFV23_11370 [Planctomycetaceae bacterium]|nr:hypothetical protein [Planctomycetaceae bacterium]